MASRIVDALPAPATGSSAAVALMLGDSDRYEIVSGGFLIALGLHGAVLAFAIVTSLFAQLRSAVDEDRARLHDFFWREYEVEVEKPKDPPKEEPPPPPEPPPPEPVAAPRPQAKAEEDPYKNLPPPTPAKAAKVLTADPKADDPVELPTVVSGEGNVVGGMQAGEGKGDRITTAKAASLQGTPGGKGTTSAAPPPPPTEDRSRGISLVGGSWRCPFPPEANEDQIDHAVVGVQITVRPDGSAASVVVTNDPGHGFGRAAKNCALGNRYNPAFDRNGVAVLQSSPVNITFRR